MPDNAMPARQQASRIQCFLLNWRPAQQQKQGAVVQYDGNGEVQNRSQQEEMALPPVQQNQRKKGIGQTARTAPVPGHSHSQQGGEPQQAHAQELTGSEVSAGDVKGREVGQARQRDAMCAVRFPQPLESDRLLPA